MPKVPYVMVEGLPENPDLFQLYKLTQDGGARWQTTNLSTAIKEGFYYAASTATNLPVPGRPCFLDVKQNGNELIQVAYENQDTGAARYARRYSGSFWTPWIKSPLPSEVQLGKVFTDSGKLLSLQNPDLNALTQIGFYYAVGSSGGPNLEFGVTTNGYVEVFTRDDSDPFISQRYTTYNDGRIFARVNNNGTWTRWKELSALTATTEYTNITLANGAQPYSGAGYNPQVAKVGNMVFLRGELASGTSAVGSIVGYLPVGYRPSQPHRFVQSSIVRTTSQEYNRWSIATNGALRLEGSTRDEGTELIADALAIHTSFLI